MDVTVDLYRGLQLWVLLWRTPAITRVTLRTDGMIVIGVGKPSGRDYESLGPHSSVETTLWVRIVLSLAMLASIQNRRQHTSQSKVQIVPGVINDWWKRSKGIHLIGSFCIQSGLVRSVGHWLVQLNKIRALPEASRHILGQINTRIKGILVRTLISMVW